MTRKKSEEEILFPEVNINNITVKPWGFGALFELSAILERVLDKAEEKGLIKDLESDFLSSVTLARLFTIANQEVLHIIAYTVGKKEEEVKKWDMQTGIKVAVTIFNQNKDTIVGALKNAVSSPLNKEEESGEQMK